MSKVLELDGRVAVVTGGARSIGLETAKRLALSGAWVIIWDLDEQALQDALGTIGHGATGAVVDVTSAADIEDAVAKCMSEFGRIEILVNNAGIAGPIASVADYGLDDWDRVIRVNLTSQFLTMRAITPLMVKGGYGRVVNLASTAAKEGNPNAAAYCAAKAGVIALTKSIAKELAKSGVLVNSICPAAVRTPMVEKLPKEHADMLLQKIPMGRLLEAEEVAAFVCWLSSEECSFSTGAAFDISGGRATY